jgi:AcrR family transcriptional regulator
MVDIDDMAESTQSSEDAVLAAAEKVFVERGYEGARMQQIADAAGINKAMLHYYFRSKDRLFKTVFEAILDRTLPALVEGLTNDLPLGLKVRRFVTAYTESLSQRPDVARFILGELTRDPELGRATIRQRAATIIPALRQQIDEAVAEGRLRVVAPEDLVLNLLALCVFPVVARPFLEPLCGLESEKYNSILAERAETVTSFVFAALAPPS